MKMTGNFNPKTGTEEEYLIDLLKEMVSMVKFIFIH